MIRRDYLSPSRPERTQIKRKLASIRIFVVVLSTTAVFLIVLKMIA